LAFRLALTSPGIQGDRGRSVPPLDEVSDESTLEAFLRTSFVSGIDGRKLRSLAPGRDDLPGGFCCCLSSFSGSVSTSAAQLQSSSMEFNFPSALVNHFSLCSKSAFNPAQTMSYSICWNCSSSHCISVYFILSLLVYACRFSWAL